MFSLGLSLTLLVFPSREGQVHIAQAAGTVWMLLSLESSVLAVFLVQRGTEQVVCYLTAAWKFRHPDGLRPGTESCAPTVSHGRDKNVPKLKQKCQCFTFEKCE